MMRVFEGGVQFGFFIVVIAIVMSGCNMTGISAQIWKAIDEDDVSAIEQLSKNNKALLSKTRLDGDTPLLYAMKKGKKDCFEALLKCGADPNQIVGRNGKAAPNYAAAEKDPYYLKMVLFYGGDPNLDNKAISSRRGAPLAFAINHDRVENVKTLLEYGANVDLKIEGQLRPIVEAAYSASFEIMLILLNAGADVGLKEKGAKSLAFAMKDRNPDLYTHPPTREACQKVWDKLKEMGVDPEKAHWEGEYFVW